MTRTRTRIETIIKNSVKKITLIITKIISRLRHYIIKTLYYSYYLIRIAFETY